MQETMRSALHQPQRVTNWSIGGEKFSSGPPPFEGLASMRRTEEDSDRARLRLMMSGRGKDSMADEITRRVKVTGCTAKPIPNLTWSRILSLSLTAIMRLHN